MTANLDKIVPYISVALILFIFLAAFFVEIFGCQLNEIFNGNFGSLFTPGIKVIG